MLLRKLAVFDNLDPACLEDVAGRLQAVKAPAGEFVVRAGDGGDAMYFVNAGAVQVQVDGLPSDRLGAGSFFGEAALTAVEEHFADVVSLGATSGVRCDPQGSPLGRRRADPTELFRLTRADFEAVAERFPALGDRLHDVGMARVRRACSPQCSPVRALRRCSFHARPNGAPAGGSGSPTRFGFLLAEGLGSAAAGAAAAAGEAGEGGAAVATGTATEGRRLSDLLIDGDGGEGEEEVDGRFVESWAPSGSCPSSPKASPGGSLWSPRRRMSDVLIDNDSEDEEGTAGPGAACRPGNPAEGPRAGAHPSRHRGAPLAAQPHWRARRTAWRDPGTLARTSHDPGATQTVWRAQAACSPGGAGSKPPGPDGGRSRHPPLR